MITSTVVLLNLHVTSLQYWLDPLGEYSTAQVKFIPSCGWSTAIPVELFLVHQDIAVHPKCLLKQIIMAVDRRYSQNLMLDTLK